MLTKKEISEVMDMFDVNGVHTQEEFDAMMRDLKSVEENRVRPLQDLDYELMRRMDALSLQISGIRLEMDGIRKERRDVQHDVQEWRRLFRDRKDELIDQFAKNAF